MVITKQLSYIHNSNGFSLTNMVSVVLFVGATCIYCPMYGTDTY